MTPVKGEHSKAKHVFSELSGAVIVLMPARSTCPIWPMQLAGLERCTVSFRETMSFLPSAVSDPAHRQDRKSVV